MALNLSNYFLGEEAHLKGGLIRENTEAFKAAFFMIVKPKANEKCFMLCMNCPKAYMKVLFLSCSSQVSEIHRFVTGLAYISSFTP